VEAMTTMTTFLPDATNFLDIPVMPNPEAAFGYSGGPMVACAKCQGHGKWNLTVNAYGPGKHFQGGCGQCWGWGWVKADSVDATCLHTFKAIAPDQPFRCWHTVACTQCGHKRSYSSDD
jgi:hypothetical protein